MSRAQGRNKIPCSYSLSLHTVERLAGLAMKRGGTSQLVEKAINRELDRAEKRQTRVAMKGSAEQPDDLKPARHKFFLG